MNRRHMSTFLLAAAAVSIAGVSQAAIVADFQFASHGMTDQSGNGYVATMHGNAVLGTGGAVMTGGYMSTNIPFSMFTVAGGHSGYVTFEILTTTTSASGQTQLIGDNNDVDLYFRQHTDGTTLMASGSNEPIVSIANAFAVDGQIHRYVWQIAPGSPFTLFGAYADGVSNITPNNTSLFTDVGAASNFEIAGINNGLIPFRGVIYEVRLSNNAVAPADFIAVPEPTSLATLSLAGLLALRRRRSA